jgi:hypothetical protein
MTTDVQELALEESRTASSRLRADALRIILGIQNSRSDNTPICLVDGAERLRETKA